MRLLVIDKTLALPVNHRKWTRLITEHGHDVLCVTADTWIEAQRTIHPQPDASHLPIHALPVASPGYENRAFFTSGLAKTIRQFRPEAIICFEEPFSAFAAQTTWIRNRIARKIPLCFYSWYNLLPDRIGGYSYAFLYDAILAYVLKSASVVFCANPEAERFYDAKRSGITRPLFFGVDVDVFTAGGIKSDWPTDRPFRIGYIGRMLAMKGIDTLLEAAARLKSDLEFEIILLGSGPESETLTTQAANLGLSDRLTMVPSTAPEHVGAILKSMDVLVLPSRSMPYWKEQFGRVLVEAMACGVPVIGSDSGAIPAVIGDAGLVFPEGDAKALAEHIHRLATHSDIWSDLQRRGLNRAPRFHADVFSDELNRLLTGLRP
jgi:glycosyltransferase involved in cell wall biosynthesis